MPAPIDRLPVELLCAMFVALFLSWIYDRTVDAVRKFQVIYPAALLNVNALWQQLAIKTRFLWTHIQFKQARSSPENLQQANIYLEHSGNLPMSVHFGQYGLRCDIGGVNQQLDRLLGLLARRMELFTVSCFYHRSAETIISALVGTGAAGRSAAWLWMYATEHNLFLHEVDPVSQSLSLKLRGRSYFTEVSFCGVMRELSSHNKITSLNVAGELWLAIWGLLDCFPHLETLEFQDLGYSYSNTTSISDQEQLLPKLHTVEIAGCDASNSKSSLHIVLTRPSVRNIIFSGIQSNDAQQIARVRDHGKCQRVSWFYAACLFFAVPVIKSNVLLICNMGGRFDKF